MERRLTTLVVFLLLGAIVNVAVAWGLALAIDIRKAPATALYRKIDPAESSVRGILFVSRWSEPGAVCLISYVGRPHHGPGQGTLEGVPELLVNDWARRQILPWILGEAPWPENGLGLDRRELDARGWPMLSFWCVTAQRRTFSGVKAEGGLQLPDRWVKKHDRWLQRITTLPYRPIGLGLAINSLFYATILWLFVFAPFATRRFIRRKRGLCIKCGYDLRGAEHEVCPECGTQR